MASSSSLSRFANVASVEEFIEEQENQNTKKKTEQNIALLKEFLTIKKRVEACRRNSPTRAQFISQRIYHYSKEKRKQRRL